MEISLKCITFGILLLEIPLIASFYTEYVVEDSCILGNETIIYNVTELGSVGTLIASYQLPYQPHKNCKIIIQPPNGLGIVASIQKVDFRQPGYYCLDYLKIIHSDVFFSPTTLCKFKFDLHGKTSYYSKGKMEMFYHVESKLSAGLGKEVGFKLTFTVVTEDLEYCLNDDMYLCNNGRCIPNRLTCDMKNNCGDSSDESSELCDIPDSPFLQATNVIYAVVGFLLILIVISLIVSLFSKLRRRNLDTDSVSDFDEPTTRLTPYQAVHPSGFFICQNPAGPHFQHSKIFPSESGFSNPCYPSGIPQAPPPYSQ